MHASSQILSIEQEGKWDISVSTKGVISDSKVLNYGMKREIDSRTGILGQIFIISIMWATNFYGVSLFSFFSVFHIKPDKKAGRDLKEPIQSEENPRKALMISVEFGVCFWTETGDNLYAYFFIFLKHSWTN